MERAGGAVNNLNEFTVDGTNMETVFITCSKCGWDWLSYQKYGCDSIPLDELVEIASKHDCEVKE